MSAFSYTVANRRRIRSFNYYLLHGILLLIPFYLRLIPLFLTILFITSFWNDSWAFRKRLFSKRKFSLLMLTAPYLLALVGMFYTENPEVGNQKLETKLAMFLLPTILLTTSIIRYEQLKELFRTYLFGVSLSAVFCLIFGLYRFFLSDNPLYLFYQEYSYFHHPTYFAMYLNLGISVLLIFIFNQENRVKFYHFALLTFLMVSTYQTSSKAGILVLGGIILFAFIYEIAPRIRWVSSLVALVISVSAAVLIASNTGYVTGRFAEIAQATNDSSESSSGGRMKIWNSAVQVIRENPLIGVGTGDVQEALDKEYKRRGLGVTLDAHKNAHNQYLESWIAHGVLGILSIVGILVILAFYGVKNRTFLLILFVFNIAFNFLFESMLEKQSGVIFISLFSAMMILIIRDGSMRDISEEIPEE